VWIPNCKQHSRLVPCTHHKANPKRS
jgi:hypothetical protein